MSIQDLMYPFAKEPVESICKKAAELEQSTSKLIG